MAAAILLPIVERPALDPFWFAVVFGINVEIGLITPPVGLNFCVVKGIVPDVSLPIVFRDELPFILSMVVGVLLLCVFSGLETPC
jgi:TRAP-type C4-dicarboxylate transport system permease large subunit